VVSLAFLFVEKEAHLGSRTLALRAPLVVEFAGCCDGESSSSSQQPHHIRLRPSSMKSVPARISGQQGV
jgi:hypothetical protein